jgi:hypothetical protein
MKLIISILAVLLLQACAGDTSMSTTGGNPKPKPQPKPDPNILTFNFVGAWSGTGLVILDKDSKIKCEDVSVEFDQIKVNLTVKSLSWNCGDLNRKLATAISYDIKEGVLYYQNKKYGMISENQIDVTIPGKNSSSKYTLKYIPGKKTITYAEDITYASSRKVWKVSATLVQK